MEGWCEGSKNYEAEGLVIQTLYTKHSVSNGDENINPLVVRFAVDDCSGLFEPGIQSQVKGFARGVRVFGPYGVEKRKMGRCIMHKIKWPMRNDADCRESKVGKQNAAQRIMHVFVVGHEPDLFMQSKVGLNK